VRASLAVLAQNAPTLAFLVTAANELLGRSRDIVDNIQGRVEMVRDGVAGADRTQVEQYTQLLKAFGDASPTVQEFLQSPVLQPEVVEVIGRLGQAAVEADQVTRGRSTRFSPWQTWRELRRDPNAGTTVAFGLAFAKSFGSHQSRVTE
ncbi:MAG: hypothetical protein WAN48_13070, partial [Actinomycetes bacterium]